MKKIMRLIVLLLGGILLLSSGQVSHVSAMQDQPGVVSDTETVVMNAASYQQHCFVLCVNTATKKDDSQEDLDENDDEDAQPQPPYYLQFNSTNPIRSSLELERYVALDPDMKIPLYKLYSVVRR